MGFKQVRLSNFKSMEFNFSFTSRREKSQNSDFQSKNLSADVVEKEDLKVYPPRSCSRVGRMIKFGMFAKDLQVVRRKYERLMV